MGKKSKNKEGGLELEVKKIKLEEPETPDITEQPELSYEEKLQYVNAIAKPMATKSQAKKLYKLIKKASKEKGYLRAGLRDVQKRIRLGETGIVVFAGDVSPIEIMCHMPSVCERKNIPYCYTPCHKDLGAAMGVKRGSIMVLIKPHPSYKDAFDEMFQEMKAMPIPVEGQGGLQLPQDKL